MTQERVVSHDDTLVSAADGMTAPFTSQTSPTYPAVEKRLHRRFLAWLSQVNRKMMEKFTMRSTKSQEHTSPKTQRVSLKVWRAKRA